MLRISQIFLLDFYLHAYTLKTASTPRLSGGSRTMSCFALHLHVVASSIKLQEHYSLSDNITVPTLSDPSELLDWRRSHVLSFFLSGDREALAGFVHDMR